MADTAQQTLFEDSDQAAASVLPPAEIRAGIPEWMPEELREKIRARKGEPYFVSFSRPEKKIMRRRKKLPVSEWAERHRHVTMSSITGPWRNEVTPYLAGIMDGIQFASVRVAAVCKCPQSGVTEAVHNFIGAAIDQDPGPVLYVFPDQETAEENSQDRILPMIKTSRRLKGYLSGTRKDESRLRINLAHMPIYLAWASSPSRLGNKPIRYAVADETDKYQTRRTRETGPIQLIDKRLTTYREISKFIKISTPTTEDGIIWQAVKNEAEVCFNYWVRCPECGRYQVMSFDRIKFLEDCRDPKEMLRRELARYECCHCSALWDDHARNRAVALGQWRAQKKEDERGLELHAYLKTHRPRNIAFHLPAWVTRFNSLSYCASVFLETLENDPTREKMKNFKNQICAEAWREVIVEPVASEYKAAICDLPAQIVPEEAIALTAGIDQQKRGFYYLVRAWARDYTSWMIHYGMLSTWEDLEHWLFETTYPVSNSARRMRIMRAAYDTGGGDEWEDTTMTAGAYMWLRKNGTGRGARVWGTKGASWDQPNVIRVSKPFDKLPNGKPIPGGLQILTLDTDQLKDAFFYRLDQARASGTDMPAWLHAATGEDYFAHITAERKELDNKGRMYWKKTRARNDWLDCECLAAAAADPEWPEGGIHLMVPPGQPGAGRPGAGAKTRGDTDRQADGGGGYDLPSWISKY